ncbi:MAG: hypothetical protein EBT55_03985, partial [Proteobacteria bacterium]|nr:hypothetical protein [Pseudomonadota bacterium]
MQFIFAWFKLSSNCFFIIQLIYIFMSIIYKKNHLAFLLAIAMFLLVIFGPKFALADVTLAPNGLDQSPITRGLCNVFEMANGNVGKAIAIFAIVACGFGFFTGKFSIALVIGITLGIGILFGAPKIIAALTGGDAVNCGNITSGESEACPGNLDFSATGLTPLVDSTTKSVTFSSNTGVMTTQLLRLECKTYSASEKRLNVSPLISSGLNVRTAMLSDTFTLLSGATLATVPTKIYNTGSQVISSNAVTGDLKGTVINFCPSVSANLTLGNTGAANCPAGSSVILQTSASSSPPSSGVMCVSEASIGTISISSSNITHNAVFSSVNASGKITIPAGLKGDVRKMPLGNTTSAQRYIVAKCNGAKWDIITTSSSDDAGLVNNTNNTCTTTTTTTDCIAPGNSVINLNLV